MTSPARTLVDLAAVLGPSQLERAVDAAEQVRVFDLPQVQAVLAAHPTKPGTACLRRILAGTDGGLSLTRSELEDRLLTLCKSAGLAKPAVNAHVEGLEVDFLWRAQRLVVEADGYAYHGSRAAFERDRIRDATLLAAGYRVLRFSHRRITTEPAVVAALIRRMLSSLR